MRDLTLAENADLRFGALSRRRTQAQSSTPGRSIGSSVADASRAGVTSALIAAAVKAAQRAKAPALEAYPLDAAQTPLKGVLDRCVRMIPLSLDVRFQPRQCIVPLLGYVIQIIPYFLDRLRFELEQAFAPDTYTAHHTGIRQHAEVLCHRLSRQTGTRGQTRNGLRFPGAQFG